MISINTFIKEQVCVSLVHRDQYKLRPATHPQTSSQGKFGKPKTSSSVPCRQWEVSPGPKHTSRSTPALPLLLEQWYKTSQSRNQDFPLSHRSMTSAKCHFPPLVTVGWPCEERGHLPWEGTGLNHGSHVPWLHHWQKQFNAWSKRKLKYLVRTL